MSSKDRMYSGNVGPDCDAAVDLAQARRKAQDDFRAGCGQDDNPYDHVSQRPQREAYTWEMARLWNQDFQAAQSQRGEPI